uniref:Uncharacterized protein n=1 Tax=Glossina palpalis gambiensis TaxID=67801 RepID=A0A1B0BSI6_9MUSC
MLEHLHSPQLRKNYEEDWLSSLPLNTQMKNWSALELQAKYEPPKSPNIGSGTSVNMSTKAAPTLKVIIPAEIRLSSDEKYSIMQTCASGITNMMEDKTRLCFLRE